MAGLTLLIGNQAQIIPRQQTSLRWAPCEFQFLPSAPNPPSVDCARLEVPLDYTKNNSETIQLHLGRIKAAKRPSRGSVFFNPGGPGAAGIDAMVAYEAELLQ